MGHTPWSVVKRRLGASIAKPTAYSFGTTLQHRALEYGPSMHNLKGMVVGRADTGHPYRIKIMRLTGVAAYVGELTDVYVDSWEPVDAED